MPAKSKAQQQLMGADLARARAGKKTRTGMSASQLEDFAATKTKGLPGHVAKMKTPEGRKAMKRATKG
jgi:Protein of unknwon function (DUF3008)